ncbi:hypothetical protein ACS0TY_010656 [Phlomoides rotata]
MPNKRSPVRRVEEPNLEKLTYLHCRLKEDLCFHPPRRQPSPVTRMQLGLYALDMAVAHLLHYFTWELPNGMKPSELDMSDVFGLSAPRVPWIKGLYLYHSQLAWYQFITATFCHFSWKPGKIYRAICFSCIFFVNSLNLPVVQQRRLLWQMEVDSYGRLVRSYWLFFITPPSSRFHGTQKQKMLEPFPVLGLLPIWDAVVSGEFSSLRRFFPPSPLSSKSFWSQQRRGHKQRPVGVASHNTFVNRLVGVRFQS